MQEKTCFPAAALDSVHLLIITIPLKAGTPSLALGNSVHSLSYCLWLGAFKAVFLAEYFINNVKELGAGPALLWFGSVSITLLFEHNAAR